MAVVAGAVVQGVVGFGIALVAAPVLLLVDPRMVPAGMLVVSCVAPWTTLAQEWRQIDWRGLRWSLVGRLAGTGGGVWLVSVLSSDGIGLAVAVMVLVAVAVSVSGVHVGINRGRLLVAGALGGVGGGQILSALVPALAGAAGGGMDIGVLAGQAVGGGVAGAIVTAIVGVIKNKMA